MKKIVFLVMRIIITISIFLLYTNIFVYSSEKTDSLKNVLNTASGKEKIEILNKLSGAYWELPPNDRIGFAEQVIDLADKYNDYESKAQAYNNLGIAYNNLGNSDKSLDYFFRALGIMEKVDDKRGIANSYINLGQAHFYLDHFEKSLEYFNKALDIRIEIGDKRDISQSLLLMGNTNGKMNQYEKALDYYSRSLVIKEEINDEIGISQIYSNFGEIYSSTEQPEKALDYRLKGLQISRKFDDKWEIAITTFNIGEAYLLNKQTEKAYPYINESYELSKYLDNKGLIRDNLYNLSLYYELKKDYKKALKYQKEFAELTKSLFSEKLGEKIAEMQIKYETEKKEKENQSYKLKLEHTNKIRLALILCLIIAFLSILFIYYHFRIKKKSALLLEELVSKKTQELQQNILEIIQIKEEKEKIFEQLLQSQKLEAIGMLAGGVAHDFNNLLTIIQGQSELIMMNIDKESDVYKDIRKIFDASVLASKLTRQLLHFSRKQPMNYNAININTTISKLLEMLKRLIRENVSVSTDLQPDLWIARADQGSIEQVIMNLSVNARDAMPEGGNIIISTKNVTIDEESCNIIPNANAGKFVCLSIEDNGKGMNKETINRIFEPFFTTKQIGTGLGLSVVYGIVKQHGGWVNIYSEQGKGSIFRIYIPHSSDGKKEVTEEIKLIEKISGNGEQILLVEDEDNIREFVSNMLQKNGYIIFEAKNTKEAIDIFNQEMENIDLVFTDVVLPDQSGLQLVNTLLLMKPKLKVLLGSGYIGAKSRWSEIEEKGFKFLQKPYIINDMLQNIKAILKQ